MIIGENGIPLIAYVFHPTATDEASEVRIARCADAACTSPGDITTIADLHESSAPPEEGGNQYAETRVLMPDDGLPIVVWTEWEEVEGGGANYLRTYKCSEPECVSGTLTTIGDRTGSEFWAAVGPDNLPLIAQRTGDWNDIALEITKCTDPSCAGAVETATVEMPGVGWALAVTVDDANLPVIAAEISGEGDIPSLLAVARCSDPLCAEHVTTRHRQLSRARARNGQSSIRSIPGQRRDDRAPARGGDLRHECAATDCLRLSGIGRKQRC